MVKIVTPPPRLPLFSRFSFLLWLVVEGFVSSWLWIGESATEQEPKAYCRNDELYSFAVHRTGFSRKSEQVNSRNPGKAFRYNKSLEDRDHIAVCFKFHVRAQALSSSLASKGVLKCLGVFSVCILLQVRGRMKSILRLWRTCAWQIPVKCELKDELNLLSFQMRRAHSLDFGRFRKCSQQ